MVNHYRFYVADLADQQIVDEVPFQTFEWEDPLSGVGRWSATLPLRTKRGDRGNSSIYRNVLEPNRTEVFVTRDKVPLWSGIVTGVRMQGTTLTFNGIGLLGYFDNRLLRETRTYDDVDQLEIVADLIEWAQGNGDPSYGTSAGPVEGDIGITVSNETSGRTRDRVYDGFQHKPIGRAIWQLSEVRDGFDIYLSRSLSGDTISRQVEFTYPSTGRETDIVFDFPGQIDSYSWSKSGNQFSNDVTIMGEGEGRDMIIGRAQDVASLDTYPLWESKKAFKDISEQDTINDRAASYLRARVEPPQQATLELKGGLGSWVVGDQVEVNIVDGYVSMTGPHRIIKQKVKVDEQGAETLTIDVITSDQT